MASDMSEAIRQLVQDKGISEDLVLKTIESFLVAAYKRKYGTADNIVVKFSDDNSDVQVFAKKSIVDDVIDPVLEIDIRQEPAVTVTPRDVGLKPDAPSGDEALCEVGGLLSHRLYGGDVPAALFCVPQEFITVMDLGRVDADEPDTLAV